MRLRYRLGLLWFSLLFVVSPLAAQDMVSSEAAPAATEENAIPSPQFSVKPADFDLGGHFLDLDGQHGSAIHGNAVVTNFGVVPVKLETYITNVSTNDFNGGPDVAAAGEPFTVPTSWIDHEPTEFTLQPQETRAVDFTVNVPVNAEPGQYVAALVASTADTWEIPGSDTVRQSLRYATLIVVLVPGPDLAGELQVGEIRLEERALIVPISNVGKYWLEPEAEIEIFTPGGELLVFAPLNLGKIYASDSTQVGILVPDQLAAGDYLVSLKVTDSLSGQTVELDRVPITVPEPPDPFGLFLDEVTIAPNAEEVVFLNIHLLVRNGGDQIPATNVILEVTLDGTVVEEFPIATNQVLLSGENSISDRYIPENDWESGTYTFRVIVFAVDPNGGHQIKLLDEVLDGELILP